jgi:hypothetical protein
MKQQLASSKVATHVCTSSHNKQSKLLTVALCCFLLRAAVSPRMNRLVQQQKLQQQQAKCKRGPKVLRPEGRDRHRTAAPAVAQRSAAAGRSRSPSPGRGGVPDYQLPTEADDLVSVVKIFLQHEVLKCARRNRLAGSPLGHRRAQHKQPKHDGLGGAATWRVEGLTSRT